MSEGNGKLMPPGPLRFPPRSDAASVGPEVEETRGRPSHVPTAENRNLVEAMTGFGIIQDDIATLLGISRPTLRKHYDAELNCGLTKANALVAQSLFKKAISGKETSASVAAAVFWLRTRGGPAWAQDMGPGVPPPNAGDSAVFYFPKNGREIEDK